MSWPQTDFTKHSVSFYENISGEPAEDDIPSIGDPKFVSVTEAGDLSDTDPMVSIRINSEARAYTPRILIRHEIVNGTLVRIPITVTDCPLYNSAIVFDRRFEGRVQILPHREAAQQRSGDV